MKWYIWVIIAVIIIVAIVLLIIFLNRKKDGTTPPKKIELNNIDSLEFSYSVGYAMNAYYRYELVCSDKCIIKIKPNGVPEEETQEYDVSEELMKKLVDMLNKYEVYKWDGFDRTAKDVLDGDSFSFTIRMKDETSIHASGYMMWPDNYRSVKEEFNNIFGELMKKESKKRLEIL